MLYRNLEVQIQFDNVNIRINSAALKWMLSSKMIKYLFNIHNKFMEKFYRISGYTSRAIFILPTLSI